METFDNETWIIEAGDEVITRKAEIGVENLTALDRLIYCLWVADYGMRNAGDLEIARDLHELFQSEAVSAAKALNLKSALAAFELPAAELEERYFDLFNDVCREIRNQPLRG